MIDTLASLDINKSGGCCEIGVHHGKFYMMLNAVIEPPHSSYAVDLFDAQHLNIDKSGKGSLFAFTENLRRYDRYNGKNTEIIQGDSTDAKLNLTARLGLGVARFVSIDGGHTAEHTLNDLKIAEQVVANEGVVIVDDILNYHWLGVIEGTLSYLNTRPTLVPFAIGQNKLFLAKLSYAAFYYSVCKILPYYTKTVTLIGHPIAAW